MADPATPPLPAPAPAAHSSLLTAGGVVLAIGALYFGRDIFIPFALSILLAFALTPFVNWFRRLKLPRIAAVLVAVTLAFVLIGGIAFVVGRQVVQLGGNLPSYQTTITQKIRSLQASAPGGSMVDKVTTTIQDLSKEISGADKPAPAPTGTGLGSGTTPPQEPVTVRLERPEAQPLDVIRSVVGPLLAPLATAGLVIVFVIFILLEQEDLRDRFIKLAGAGDLQKSTQALNDAAARVSRYLLMQLVVNLTYGVPIGLALYLIGVPNAVLWGLLAAVLRFVPYLGPFLAALFPIALAVAVDPGWSMLLWVVALFLVAELISNNVVEPWLYGSSTGLSSLAIIMAAIFWTTLWGPVGLFLATPLTVCLVVIGRYVPQLEFLGVLLGSDPVLAPEERLYQRLLAGNLEEAVEMAETYVDEQSSRAFYDHVAMPALRLAENDRQRSTTDTNYRRQVASTATCVVREIADHVREKAAQAAKKEGVPTPDEAAAGAVRVLCIAGRTELDGAAAEMVAQALEERSIGARVLPPISVSEGALGQLDLAGIDVVCLSYLHPQPQVFARYICRRLRRRAPHVKSSCAPGTRRRPVGRPRTWRARCWRMRPSCRSRPVPRRWRPGPRKPRPAPAPPRSLPTPSTSGSMPCAVSISANGRRSSTRRHARRPGPSRCRSASSRSSTRSTSSCPAPPACRRTSTPPGGCRARSRSAARSWPTRTWWWPRTSRRIRASPTIRSCSRRASASMPARLCAPRPAS
jgi:predicted PurR-regulated permease PerM